MSYHIFDKDAVDIICRDYGGDPRVMIIALNGAVSDELRDLAEAASVTRTNLNCHGSRVSQSGL